MEELRVLVIGSDPLARTGLAMLLRDQEGITDAGQVAPDEDGITNADALRGAPGVSQELPESLTPRELEVLQLLAQGLPNKQIAQRLGISDHTAKFHVNAILGKLGVQSRSEAIVQAVRMGLVLL
jgi:DNA-binding CsgD family transcriptional regulator